ncbi:hypothetical protein C8F04DRAFT_1174815 [Mycena alexandri]|uniref:Uncharacterized protein n=1 Tax=Mycena alexandri TaxID=1745969 RepID=A0AAD6TDV2_9AGAR|nr:hypothetical protein C8F04DRAFT_1174815 [Mycena alexandri]
MNQSTAEPQKGSARDQATLADTYTRLYWTKDQWPSMRTPCMLCFPDPREFVHGSLMTITGYFFDSNIWLNFNLEPARPTTRQLPQADNQHRGDGVPLNVVQQDPLPCYVPATGTLRGARGKRGGPEGDQRDGHPVGGGTGSVLAVCGDKADLGCSPTLGVGGGGTGGTWVTIVVVWGQGGTYLMLYKTTIWKLTGGTGEKHKEREQKPTRTRWTPEGIHYEQYALREIISLRCKVNFTVLKWSRGNPEGILWVLIPALKLPTLNMLTWPPEL